MLPNWFINDAKTSAGDRAYYDYNGTSIEKTLNSAQISTWCKYKKYQSQWNENVSPIACFQLLKYIGDWNGIEMPKKFDSLYWDLFNQLFGNNILPNLPQIEQGLIKLSNLLLNYKLNQETQNFLNLFVKHQNILFPLIQWDMPLVLQNRTRRVCILVEPIIHNWWNLLYIRELKGKLNKVRNSGWKSARIYQQLDMPANWREDNRYRTFDQLEEEIQQLQENQSIYLLEAAA